MCITWVKPRAIERQTNHPTLIMIDAGCHAEISGVFRGADYCVAAIGKSDKFFMVPRVCEFPGYVKSMHGNDERNIYGCEEVARDEGCRSKFNPNDVGREVFQCCDHLVGQEFALFRNPEVVAQNFLAKNVVPLLWNEIPTEVVD